MLVNPAYADNGETIETYCSDVANSAAYFYDNGMRIDPHKLTLFYAAQMTSKNPDTIRLRMLHGVVLLGDMPPNITEKVEVAKWVYNECNYTISLGLELNNE